MAKGVRPGDDVPTKFSKLLPAEVTALYLSLRPLVNQGAPDLHLVTAIVSLLCAVLFIRITRGVTNWLHIAVYTLTFVIWVFTLEPEGFKYYLNDRWHVFDHATDQVFRSASVVCSILWTFLVTNVVPNALLVSRD